MKEVNPMNVAIICATIIIVTAAAGGYLFNGYKTKCFTENGYEQQLVGSYPGWVKVEMP